MKRQRHEVVVDLIKKYDIETQEELIDILRREGFNVTQATVSRDIRELKLTKVTAESGKYKYVLPDVKKQMGEGNVYGSITAAVLGVECAVNIVIVKTYPGMASAVATGIDSYSIDGVAGCIAGDDTIFVAVRSVDSAARVAADIRRIFGS